MDYIIFCGALKQRHQNNIISVPDDVKRENVDRYVLSWGYVYAIIRSSPALGNNNNTFNHWYQWRVDQNLTLFLSNEEGGRVFCGYPDISGSGVGVLIIIVPQVPTEGLYTGRHSSRHHLLCLLQLMNAGTEPRVTVCTYVPA